MTGFYPEAGKWKVRGWSMSPDPLAPITHVKSDGQVEGMLVDGNLLKVKFMEARRDSAPGHSATQPAPSATRWM